MLARATKASPSGRYCARKVPAGAPRCVRARHATTCPGAPVPSQKAPSDRRRWNWTGRARTEITIAVCRNKHVCAVTQVAWNCKQRTQERPGPTHRQSDAQCRVAALEEPRPVDEHDAFERSLFASERGECRMGSGRTERGKAKPIARVICNDRANAPIAEVTNSVEEDDRVILVRAQRFARATSDERSGSGGKRARQQRVGAGTARPRALVRSSPILKAAASTGYAIRCVRLRQAERTNFLPQH